MVLILYWDLTQQYTFVFRFSFILIITNLSFLFQDLCLINTVVVRERSDLAHFYFFQCFNRFI